MRAARSCSRRGRQAGDWAGRQAGRQAGGWAAGRARRQAGRQAGRLAGRQAPLTRGIRLLQLNHVQAYTEACRSPSLNAVTRSARQTPGRSTPQRTPVTTSGFASCGSAVGSRRRCPAQSRSCRRVCSRRYAVSRARAAARRRAARRGESADGASLGGRQDASRRCCLLVAVSAAPVPVPPGPVVGQTFKKWRVGGAAFPLTMRSCPRIRAA
eukprot:353169-Chlamydomonas_euryale.AAC.9